MRFIRHTRQSSGALLTIALPLDSQQPCFNVRLAISSTDVDAILTPWPPETCITVYGTRSWSATVSGYDSVGQRAGFGEIMLNTIERSEP